MIIDLRKKVVLVTGATGKLGQVFCRMLYECGATVRIHYFKNYDKAVELKKQMIGSEIFQADLTKEEDVIRLKNEVGDIDVLISNAVAQYPWEHVLEGNLEDFRSQFDTCVLSNFLLYKAFIKGMRLKGTGRIIGINTECVLQKREGQGAYVAGKAGMDALYKVLSKEAGGQITVNQIAPGWTVTEEFEDTRADYIPLRRRGFAEEVGNVVCFLASDLASYVNGVMIPVNGGNI